MYGTMMTKNLDLRFILQHYVQIGDKIYKEYYGSGLITHHGRKSSSGVEREWTGFEYCKSTNFGVLLYLANLANCVFSLIFVAAKIYVDRTLHRRAAGRRQI